MQIINTITISTALLASWVAAQGTLTANTPGSLFECRPGLLTWTGGVAPYFPRINQPGSTTQTLELLPQTNSNSYTWTVNLSQGTTFTFAVADSTGAQGYSAISPAIGPGDSSCLNSTATSVAGASSTGSQTAATTTSSTPATTGQSTTTRLPASSSSSSGSTPTTSASSSGNGASKVQGFAAVAAGAVGVVVAALI